MVDGAAWAPQSLLKRVPFWESFRPRWKPPDTEGRGQVIHIELTIKQGDLATGKDEGLLWCEGGVLRFRGYRSTFDLTRSDTHIALDEWPSFGLGVEGRHDLLIQLLEKKIIVDDVLPRWTGLKPMIQRWLKEDGESEEVSHLPPLSVQRTMVDEARRRGIAFMSIHAAQVVLCLIPVIMRWQPVIGPFRLVLATLLALGVTWYAFDVRKNLRRLNAAGQTFGFS